MNKQINLIESWKDKFESAKQKISSVAKEMNPKKIKDDIVKGKKMMDHASKAKSNTTSDKVRRAANSVESKGQKRFTKGMTKAAALTAALGTASIGAGLAMRKAAKDGKKKQAEQQSTNKPNTQKKVNLPNGKSIAKAAIPAAVVAGGVAAIYAWWKKKHGK